MIPRGHRLFNLVVIVVSAAVSVSSGHPLFLSSHVLNPPETLLVYFQLFLALAVFGVGVLAYCVMEDV